MHQLRIRSLYRVTLPVPATPFLGRERELGEVTDLLARDDLRVLTLTGPGGTGKTRLALQAAAAASHRFPDGVWWVPLAPLRDASLVLPTVAQILEVAERPDVSFSESLPAALAGKRALLVFDNLEHLLPDVVRELGLLTATEGPVLLLTSRERMQVQGEHIYAVPTLDAADGVALFMARARALCADIAADGAVAELCARLDHLPLAIELAAARTVVFTPAQLLDRLSQRLDLLKGGRNVDPRQQTLRSTIEWSFDLLNHDERRLFGGLSVFKGGCTFAAAERICSADPDTLQSSIDKSLVRRRETDHGQRFWMLASIAQFAAESISSDARPALRSAHLAWFAEEVFVRADATRKRESEALAVHRAEQANVFEALGWAIETMASEPAQKIVAGSWFYWIAYGLGVEGDGWASRVVALPSEPTLLLADALTSGGEFPRFRGDPARALILKRQGLAIFDSLDASDPRVADISAATHSDLADLLSRMGDFDRAVAHAELALEMRRLWRNPARIAHAIEGVGVVALRRGSFGEAADRFEEAVELYEGTGGDRHEAAGTLIDLAMARRALGDLPAASAALQDALRRAEASGDRGHRAWALSTLGVVAADDGRTEDAVALLAQAMTETHDIGLSLDSDIAPAVESALERSRKSLGDEAYEVAYAAGVEAATGRAAVGD